MNQKFNFQRDGWFKPKNLSAGGWGLVIFWKTITGHTVATNSVLETGTSVKVTYFIPL